MLGAIIGDTVGSIYEFNNIKKTDFVFFGPDVEFTDDSVLTVAVADWLLNDHARSMDGLEKVLVSYTHDYPNPMGAYGSGYLEWVHSSGKRTPYNSCGNGSAMRASACGWVAQSLNDALELGKLSAQITHNHPEGIKGAQAVSAAIYMGLHGSTKEEIRSYIVEMFGYDIMTCDEIRPEYGWGATCQDTVPEAFAAFFDSTDFESAIRLAVSLGGDSDTLACITGGIAQAFYKDIPQWMIDKMVDILPKKFIDIIEKVGGISLR
ncbi:MAG: ADP-ribosylglycohydrolase family protein [Bacteroidales bacterium]|nr:ADP-ribosylglycohydrolase family protein [Bacteroidales bacterium]